MAPSRKTTRLITLYNDFHATEVRVRVGPLSERTVRRVRRSLCGIDGCTCGGDLSERGQQEAEIRYTALGEFSVAAQD